MLINMKKIFNRIMEAIHKSSRDRKGTLDFTTGNYEIFVHAEIHKDEEVDFLIEAVDHSTCSYLPTNKIDISEGENGFNLKASIESNEVKIHWKIK
jgi:hypothetical protein